MLNQPFVKQIDLRGFSPENLEQFLSDVNNAVFANPDILKKLDELNTRIQSDSKGSPLTHEELDNALKTFDDGLSSLSDIFKSFEQKSQNMTSASSSQSQLKNDNVHRDNLNSKNQSKESKESKDTFDSLAEMYKKNKEKGQRQGQSHHTYFEQQDKSKVESQTKDNKRTSRNVDRINIGALNEFRNRQQMSEDYANSLNNSNNQDNVEHEDANAVRETIVSFGNHNSVVSGESADSSVHQSDNSEHNNDIKDNEMTNTNNIENSNASVAVDNEILTKQEQERDNIDENETNLSSEYSATATLTERLEAVIPKLLKVAKDIDNAKVYEEVAQSLSKLEKIDNASPSYINYVTHVRDKIQENQSRQAEIVNLIELIEEIV